jgi:hypothetical protein
MPERNNIMPFPGDYLKQWESGTSSGLALSFAAQITPAQINNHNDVQNQLNSVYRDLSEGAGFFKDQVQTMLQFIKQADGDANATGADKSRATAGVYTEAAGLPLWDLLINRTPLFIGYCDRIMGLFKDNHSTNGNTTTLKYTDATTTVAEWRDIFEACDECSTCAPFVDSGTPEPWKCNDKFFCVKQMWTYIAAGCLVAVVILMLMMTMK